MLRDKLGAELVESVDPMYRRRSGRAEHEVHLPGRVRGDPAAQRRRSTSGRRRATGELEFAVPGWDVTTTDYMSPWRWARRRLSDEAQPAPHQPAGLANPSSPFTINKYLAERGDARIKDWATWVAERQVRERRAAVPALRTPSATRIRARAEAGISYLKMQSVLRMVVLKVMHENGIDVFVNPEQTTPPYMLGGRRRAGNQRSPARSAAARRSRRCWAARRSTCPPATRTIAYDPQYVLTADKKTYVEVTGDGASRSCRTRCRSA